MTKLMKLYRKQFVQGDKVKAKTEEEGEGRQDREWKMRRRRGKKRRKERATQRKRSKEHRRKQYKERREKKEETINEFNSMHWHSYARKEIEKEEQENRKRDCRKE